MTQKFLEWDNKFSPTTLIYSASNINTTQIHGKINTDDDKQESPMRINYKDRMMKLFLTPDYLDGGLSVGGANFNFVDYSKTEFSNMIPCGGYLSSKIAYGNNECKLGFKL